MIKHHHWYNKVIQEKLENNGEQIKKKLRKLEITKYTKIK